MHGVRSADLPAKKNVNMQMAAHEEERRLEHKNAHDERPAGAPLAQESKPTDAPDDGAKLTLKGIGFPEEAGGWAVPAALTGFWSHGIRSKRCQASWKRASAEFLSTSLQASDL